MNEDQTIVSISDHDILIELRTEMRGLRDDFKNLTASTASQIGSLQAGKLDKEAFAQFRIADETLKADHEVRIRRLERWGLIALGGLGLIEIALNLYATFHK